MPGTNPNYENSDAMTRKPTPLEDALNQMEKLTAEIESGLNFLEEKLAPVSRPAPSCDQSEAKASDPRAVSPVVNQIENYNNRLRRSLENIKEITANLEV